MISRHLYEAMIYWVYCDYSLLEAPWSKLLALLDLIIEYISQLRVDEWLAGLGGNKLISAQ